MSEIYMNNFMKDADNKGLSKISDEVKFLPQKAKKNSLKPEDYEGGTFTMSNLGGPFGIKQFCAIINPLQAAALAVGSGAIGAVWLKAFKDAALGLDKAILKFLR